jgi:hypothetical protein
VIRRSVTLIMTCAAVALIALTLASRPVPLLLWNGSGSASTGLCRVQPIGTPAVAALVVVAPPEPLAAFLEQGGYLSSGIALLKRILALARPVRLPRRPARQHQWNRRGRGARARPPGTPSLRRLPSDRRGIKSFSCRRAGGARRPLLRADSVLCDPQSSRGGIDLREAAPPRFRCKQRTEVRPFDHRILPLIPANSPPCAPPASTPVCWPHTINRAPSRAQSVQDPTRGPIGTGTTGTTTINCSQE